jgi:exosortase/archaeosortase family protein
LTTPRVRSARWRAFLLLVVLMESLPIAGAIEIFLEDELRLASATVATILVALTGTPVSRQGTTVCGSRFRVEVFPPCAGGRILAAMLACGFVAVAASRASRARRTLVLLLLVPAGLTANASRVALIFLLANTDPVVHDRLGLLCFSFVAFLVVRASGLGVRKEVPTC